MMDFYVMFLVAARITMFPPGKDVLVSLGGWDKKPTGGVRVYFSCCFLTGKVKIRGSLFDWRWAIALLEEVGVVCRQF